MQFIDLGAQRARIEDKINHAVAKVVAGGHYILGPEVAEFERQMASYLGVKHAIACANGTDALLMPLMARNIGRGDAVFCPGFTFAATAEVIALTGAEPVFIDVLPDSFNMDPQQLAETIAATRREGRLKPKAIIPVDLFGLPADYDALAALAAAENLFVIEDAAQAIGGKWRGADGKTHMCGALGDVGATSFYPAKPLGCYGDGGAMFTNNDELAAVLRSLLFHGKGETQYDNVRIGLNSRLDTVQAAILLEKLAILEDEMEKRAQIGARYAAGLSDIVRVPHIGENRRSAYAQYTIRVPGGGVRHRDALKAHLQEAGIPSVVYYIKPLHLQTAYKHFPRAVGGLPVSEQLAHEVLSLPMHPYLSAADQDKIIGSIRAFMGVNSAGA
ncbi:DegT/DnrJ/EryC1/StrS family aminotransferase [Candidatus Tokpelaia sp.]|uniref:DegT/DnrJ/EryC1/StrS family aminotransferase n=1 Tax=Candidatus Tokpelaia sp. TaxID=2233777 RepID=UPI00123A8C76|nr:DegT/DnrJ/EryC1/StrS aminotransferase family protein [Candidatus Tokpelaia sp.]KAA6405171.1 aminotransferase DegT [Candidatus Tokpelaia sp.]